MKNVFVLMFLFMMITAGFSVLNSS